MKIIEMDQQSPEWLKLRAGLPSASCFDKIITSTGKPSTQADKYMYQLAGEKLLGMKEESYQNDAMRRGVELEPEARMFYELSTGVDVVQVGFCLDERGFGCSPDGLVGEDGLIEIKCPILSTHISYLVNESIVEDYWHQIQGQLLVTGRKWCDAVSYYPNLPTLIVRVERNEEFIKKLETELLKFVDNLQKTISKISYNK